MMGEESDDRSIAGVDFGYGFGVRTFMTIFDADGSVTSWGGDDMDDCIFREMYVADRLRKRISKMEKTPQTKTKRRRRHRAMLCKLQRMLNLVDNMQYNLIAL